MKKSILSFVILLNLANTAICSSAFSASATPSLQSKSQACLDSDPEHKKLLSQFMWYSKDPELKVDFCDPKNLAYRVANVLLFLKSTGTSNLHLSQTDRFAPGVLESDPFQFFAKRIRVLQFDPDDPEDDDSSGCDAYTAAYVNAATRSGVMHICRHLSGQHDLTISSALIHEARHQDSYHRYAVCKHGFMIGQTACDESYASGDSYSVQTEYLVKVSRSQQIDPLTRQTARATALNYFANRFNTLPLGIKRGAVLVTSDSKLVFYDGVTVTPMLSLPRPSTQVYQSADLLKFYDPITRVLSRSFDGANLLTEVTDYDMNLGGGNFVDRYRTQRANCWLFTNRLICEFPEKRVNLPIIGFTPASFQSYSLQDRFDKKVRIVSKERQVYSITFDSTDFYPEATDYLNTGKWDENTTIGLSYDGKIYFETSSSAKQFAPGLDLNIHYIKMIAPYYWSPELQKL